MKEVTLASSILCIHLYQLTVKNPRRFHFFFCTQYKVVAQKHGVISCGLDAIRLVWRGIKTGIIPLLPIFSLQSSIDYEAAYEPNICCASLPKGMFYVWNITHILISQIHLIAVEALIQRQSECDLHFSSLYIS